LAASADKQLLLSAMHFFPFANCLYCLNNEFLNCKNNAFLREKERKTGF
jgi:hypothetical protein